MAATIRTRTIGHRTVLGTEWPIVDQVRRLGPRSWQVVYSLCNGVPAGDRIFRTRREALEEYAQTEPIGRRFVITADGWVLVQIEDEGPFGFHLADDDQVWVGGFGAADRWEVIARDDPRITPADHERLDWLLDAD